MQKKNDILWIQPDSTGEQYLDLKRLSIYSSLAIPTLRDYLATGSLPHFKLRGKILVKRSEFDQWIQIYRASPKRNLNDLVENAIERVSGSITDVDHDDN